MGWRLPVFLDGGMRKLQDWSFPEKLRPSTWLHFSGKWINWTIAFITNIVHQALAMIAYSCVVMVRQRKTSIDWIYRFRTQSHMEIRTIVFWLLTRDRLKYPTKVRVVSLKFSFCLIIVLTINFKVHVSICCNWNGGSYWRDVLLWYTTNGNKRLIID